jgi:glyoxylase-like metal-dependent hydrolase (beta-lactamase superfamily II)
MSPTRDLYFRQEAVGEMANLAYLVGSVSTREALVVDPAWSVDRLLDLAESDGMTVVGALATHYHQDHVGGQIFGWPRTITRTTSAARSSDSTSRDWLDCSRAIR